MRIPKRPRGSPEDPHGSRADPPRIPSRHTMKREATRGLEPSKKAGNRMRPRGEQGRTGGITEGFKGALREHGLRAFMRE